MNANRHRIIFNHTRGQLMAVAEIASACGKSSGQKQPGTTPGAPAPALTLARLRPAAFATLLALGAQLTIVPLASAQIVAYKAAPASQRPTVLTAGNGVPLVNIQTPSAAGVSRNTYSQFDVDQNGVILNNARNNALTQLGGWVQGNPWLARGSARVILNEVVSANPSQLRGYIEVAGSSAQVVIANPAGIACDGCGFINASRSTLTTGTPVVNGGNLESYRVEGGTIRIDGAGLDASRSAYTDLIARAVEVNAGLWAQTLKVSTGANVIDAVNSTATPISPAPGSGGAAPAFSIDVASLGGMYAGKITLVGTEAGVGVKNTGWIGASAGEVIVSADGRLQNSGSIVSSRPTTIDAAAGISNSGTLYAQGDLTLATRGNLDNGGLIAAQGNATLTASGAGSKISGDAAAVFAAGLNTDGSLAPTGKLTLAASEQVAAHGQHVAGGDLTISGRNLDLADSRNSAQNIVLTASAGDLDLARTNSVASATLSAHSTQTLRHDDARSNASQLDLAAHSLGNARGELIQTGSGSTVIALAGDLDNTAGRIAANSLNLSLSAQGINNTDGSIEHAGTGSLTITADTLTGTRGSIVSNGALALTVGTATLDAATTVADALNIVAGSLANQGGLISQSGSGEARVTVAGRFDNRGGSLASSGSAKLTTDDLDNRSSGQIVVSSDLDLSSGDLANDSGRISASHNLIAVAREVGNAGGLIVAGNDLTFTATRLDNTSGTLGAVAGSLGANIGGAVDNTRGRIEAAQNLTLASNGLTNTDGTVVGNTLAIDTHGAALDNRRGILVAAASLGLQTGQLTNHGGLIQANDVLTIDTHGQRLANTGAGSIIGQRSVRIASGNLDNASGLIGAKGDLEITGTAIANTAGGRINSEADIALAAASLDNRGGQIEALGGIDVRTSGHVDNDASLMRAGRALNVAADSLSNANTLGSDQGLEGQSLTIAASNINNRSGAMRADTTLVIESSGTLDNSAGLISSTQTLSVRDPNVSEALAITNTAGTVIAGTRLDIDSASLSGDGKLLSLGDMSVKLVADFTHSGAFAELTADGSATLETAGTLTNRATLQAGTALALTAATIDNQSTGQILAPELRLSATDSDTLTNRGLIDGGDTRIDAVSLNNLGTGHIYGDHLSIAATTLNNEAEGGNAPVIAARDRLDLGITTLNNREGAHLFSVGDLSIGGSLDAGNHATGTATLMHNHGATIEALGKLDIAAVDIRNTNAGLVTETVAEGDSRLIQEVQPEGWARRYDVAYFPSIFNYRVEAQPYVVDGIVVARFEDYTFYNYNATTTATRVVSSTPGQILASGDLTLSGELLNSDSQIIAGGTLTQRGGSLLNTSSEGLRTTSYSGWAQFRDWDGKKEKLKFGGIYGFSPAPETTSFNLDIARFDGSTPPGGSGTTVAARMLGAVGQRASGAAGASTAIGSGSAVPRITRVDIPGTAGGAGAVVATLSPRTTLPTSSLYHTDPTAGQPLVKADPRFATYRQWLSSDYMLTQLALNPATTQKRLGDGFYEQRLINEQVAQLTGRRFLVGYANEEEQYRALLNAGVTYARTWNLIPGVALEAGQMAQLTSDMVWLVEQDVVLADGSTQKVLVPQLYARVQSGDLAPSGALLAGNTVDIDVSGELSNLGTIAGRQLVSLTAENIKNLGGRVTGGEVFLTARQNVEMRGGTLAADSRLDIAAGRNIDIASTTRSSENREGGATFSRTNLDRIASLYVSNPSGVLQLEAGSDIALLAAHLINSAPTAAGNPGRTVIDTGGNLTLGTLAVEEKNHTGEGKNHNLSGSRSEIGTRIESDGDIALLAGNTLSARAATVSSQSGALLARAGQDIVLEAGEATSYSDIAQQSTRKGFLSSKTKMQRDAFEDGTAIASTFSGDSTTLIADRDIAIKGSNVVATNDTTLIAARDLRIEAATETHSETHVTKTKQSGVFSSGGVGFTLGKRQQSTDQQSDATFAVKSTVGSTDGNVILLAGEKYRQVGSDVIAVQGDIDIAAKTVDIVEARETSRTVTETKSKQSGLTVAITSPVISAIQTVQQMTEAAPKAKDARLQALAVATTGLAAKNAADAIASDPQAGGGVGVSITVGGSKSSSRTTQTSNTAAASNLTAGQDITITASGAGSESDLTVQGSRVTAGRNIALSADDEIRLLAASNESDLERRSKSSSAGVGVAVTYGSNGFAAGITANASASKGKADGQDTTWNNTNIEAGNLLALESGGDTTLRGAVASGKQITADIGGNLAIESLQDTSTYRRMDQSIGGSVTVGYGFAASANVGQQKIDSDFASVIEQSGLQAGDGGFDIRVTNNTDLKGAVIASSALAAAEGRNRLESGTLTTSDIENKAEYEASSVSIGGGYSQGSSMIPLGGGNSAAGAGVGTDQQGKPATGGQTPGSVLPDLGGFSASPPSAMSAKDDAKSTTQSGISAAIITLNDEARQQELTGKSAEQTLASLNTNVTTGKDTSNALRPIFDEQQIDAGFAIVGAFSREVGTFLVNRAKEADTKNAQADTIEQLAKDFNNALPDDQRLALLDQARSLRVEAQSISDNWGAGGTYRQIATALVAAASGNISAASGEFARNMVGNYVQQQGATYIGKLVADGTLTEGSPLHAALHGIVACAGAAASNQGCAGGASGAAASSLLTGLFSDTNPNETQAEREARRNLIVSIVTGIAAGSGQAAAATNAAAVAAVDNNWLATQQIVQMKKELAAAPTVLEQMKVAGKWALISSNQNVLTTAGIGKGLAEAGWSDIKGVAEFLADPMKGLEGMKQLINSPAAREQLGDRFFKELDDKINRMQTALGLGGDQNAEQLGKDFGGLLWQVGSVVTGAGGIAKGGVALAKVGVNVGKDVLEGMQISKAYKLADAEAIESARRYNNFYRDGAAQLFPQELKTSSGITIKANPDKTTTVLGSFGRDTSRIINDELGLPKSMVIEGGTQPGSFNVLNTPDILHNTLGPQRFWEQVNKPFLDAALRRGDDIVLATKPDSAVLRNTANTDGLSGFGREYKYLIDHGYAYNAATGRMCVGVCR